MTTALVQDGKAIQYTCTGNVSGNALYAIGATGGALGLSVTNGLPVVPASSGTTGDLISFITEGVFTLSKIAEGSSALVKGQKVFYRTTGGVNELTGVSASADGVAGIAWDSAVTGASTATVKLLGFANYAAV